MSNRNMKLAAFGVLAAAVMISNISLTAKAALPSAGAGVALDKPVEIVEVAQTEVTKETVAPEAATEVGS